MNKGVNRGKWHYFPLFGFIEPPPCLRLGSLRCVSVSGICAGILYGIPADARDGHPLPWVGEGCVRHVLCVVSGVGMAG